MNKNNNNNDNNKSKVFRQFKSKYLIKGVLHQTDRCSEILFPNLAFQML